MLWLLNSRPEGDRIPAFDLKGGIFLIGGVLAGVVAVVAVRTERGVTSLGFNLLGAAARPASATSAARRPGSRPAPASSAGTQPPETPEPGGGT
jgi:hypothetical protein